MPSEWVRRGDGSITPRSENSLEDVEFKPSVFKTELETSFKAQLEAQQAAADAKMQPLLDMAAALKAEREEKAAAAAAARAAKSKEDNKIEDEDWMLNPEGAVDKKLQGTNTAIKMLAARGAKQDALGDKEYYHGDIKSKVDAMLAAQTLDAQCRADVIENCYKLVMFDHMKDINDGKIKARNSAGVFEGGSTGAHSGKEAGESAETLSADEKVAARNMGINDADWIKARREMVYV